MMNDEQPEMVVQGIWMPLSVFDDMSVPWIAKFIFLQIHSYKKNDLDCFVSNEYLSKKFQVSITRVSNIISSLITKGWIEQTRFDGRKRYLRSCMEVSFKAGLNKSLRQDITLVQGSIEEKVKDNKEDNNKSNKKNNKRASSPPTLIEWMQYFEENSQPKEVAERAFRHYNGDDDTLVGEWKDANGKPVINWKQKARTNWFNKSYDKKTSSNSQRQNRGYTDQELRLELDNPD